MKLHFCTLLKEKENKQKVPYQTSANNLTSDRFSSKTRELNNNLCKSPSQINGRYSPQDRVEYL